MNLKSRSTILFIGDSVTDCGRNEHAYGLLGNGYVNFVGNWLYAKYMELDLNVINKGISGNTVRDIKGRWQSDCINVKPDLLSILIGINDVWRRHREPERIKESVAPEEYQTTYRQILDEAVEKIECKIVLIEPFMFCNDINNPMFKDLQTYISIVRNLAKEFNALLIPMQDLLSIEMKKVHPNKWAGDMVHPYTWSHAWIAQRWLEYSQF
ncbi:MAG: hypothetical protein A2Y12_11860 [Planctomycetes bacterium GWF2_42_9]|nr:MAG: hypothetical protein A2Y12_11860 [Planctomycetes bacterium GWF2_42_9]